MRRIPRRKFRDAGRATSLMYARYKRDLEFKFQTRARAESSQILRAPAGASRDTWKHQVQARATFFAISVDMRLQTKILTTFLSSKNYSESIEG